MSNLMRYKTIYFIVSLLIILPGIWYLITSGLKLGIDFTGGTLLEYQFEKEVNVDDLKTHGQVTQSGEDSYIIRTKPLDQNQIDDIRKSLTQKYGNVVDRRVEFVGPVMGAELSKKAAIAVVVASLVIVLYIAFCFRKIPKPQSSWRFGIAAVVALIHDILLIIGAFAIFGEFFGIEIDTLFVTALLTIIGFSVHDTIVVFDRIRENLTKQPNKKFIEIANLSVIQTLGRSLNTSLTVGLVIFLISSIFKFSTQNIIFNIPFLPVVYAIYKLAYKRFI